MATLTIRLPDDQHERLKLLAARRGTSLNKLFEEFSVKALTEADTEARFLSRVARGNVQAGLALLDRLDEHYRRKRRRGTDGLRPISRRPRVVR